MNAMGPFYMIRDLSLNGHCGGLNFDGSVRYMLFKAFHFMAIELETHLPKCVRPHRVLEITYGL